MTLILCLRDWLMVLPIQQMVREGTLSTTKLNTVFEVNHRWFELVVLVEAWCVCAPSRQLLKIKAKLLL